MLVLVAKAYIQPAKQASHLAVKLRSSTECVGPFFKMKSGWFASRCITLASVISFNISLFSVGNGYLWASGAKEDNTIIGQQD